jgi:hypothetical protein
MVGSRSPFALLAAEIALLSAFTLRAAEPAKTLWPWAARTNEATFTLYQPQVDRWAGDLFEGRAAVAAVRKGEKEPTYGVVWIRARTSLGGVPGQVTLEELVFTKASFPWEGDGGAAILEAIRHEAGTTATVPFASLNASPAVELGSRRAAAPSPPAPEPRVIHARGPAVLVLVDGPYDIRPVPGTTVLRVVNTRALLLQDSGSSRFYLSIGRVWLVAPAPNGKWTVAKRLPQGLESVRKAAASEPGVELFERPAQNVAALLRAGKAPAIIVSTTPAVLASKAPQPEKARPAVAMRAGRPAGLYAGPDGNVYRPRPAGGWDKTNGRDWYPVQERTPGRGSPARGLIGRLDAERRARAAGMAGDPSGSHRPS